MVITTYAGNGIAGSGGDNGAATLAQLYNYGGAAVGVATDNNGNVYIADNGNSRIRMVSSSGIITTIAGTGVDGYSGDNGQATLAQLYNPRGVTVDTSGKIYILDRFNKRIRLINNGIITTIAGTGSDGYGGDTGPASLAVLNYPQGIATDTKGNLYIADTENYRVRLVTSTGIITTIAGTGTSGNSADNIPATSAQLSHPYAVVPLSSGSYYIVDAGNCKIRLVSIDGTITTYAGTGSCGYSGDNGPATSGQLSNPFAMAMDLSGKDQYTYRIYFERTYLLINVTVL